MSEHCVAAEQWFLDLPMATGDTGGVLSVITRPALSFVSFLRLRPGLFLCSFVSSLSDRSCVLFDTAV